MYRYDRRYAAGKLDPTKPLEGNAVAYFDIDGDPESLDLHKGEVPLHVVTKYLQGNRLKAEKVQPGHHPDELLVHFKGYDGQPASFTTKIKVQSRK